MLVIVGRRAVLGPAAIAAAQALAALVAAASPAREPNTEEHETERGEAGAANQLV